MYPNISKPKVCHKMSCNSFAFSLQFSLVSHRENCKQTIWSSTQKSRGQRVSSLLQVNPRFMFVSQQTVRCCLQSRSQPITRSTAGYRNWYVVQKCAMFLKLGQIKVGSCSNEPYQSSFVTRLGPLLGAFLGLVVLVRTRVWLLFSRLIKGEVWFFAH